MDFPFCLEMHPNMHMSLLVDGVLGFFFFLTTLYPTYLHTDDRNSSHNTIHMHLSHPRLDFCQGYKIIILFLMD